MINKKLLKKLPEKYIKLASDYNICDEMLIQDKELVILILDSMSISVKEEKQEWFDLYLKMNEEKIGKLYDILKNEKNKIEEITKKYEEKVIDIKKKYEEKEKEILEKWKK